MKRNGLPRSQSRIALIARATLLLGLMMVVGVAVICADVPTRIGVRGTVPMPGTQQQELANITFPSPYNVFEFLVTCAACHGGQVDQQVAHFGNWAGTAMASAARDPVFRASQIIADQALQDLSGQPGGGNMCFRCHSPNGWYSGRFDPNLNGASDGSRMLHSILLSTDDEGVTCEQCHRTMGAATFKRADLDPNDPAWNLMAGIADWPHSGMPYLDQDGDGALLPGDVLGDGTLQIADGMTYIGRYPGTADILWSDLPIVDVRGTRGGLYTGQTYGIYPPGWIDALGNNVGGKPATAAGGELLLQLDIPIGPPLNPDGSPCYSCQSVSPEHATVKYPNLPPAKGFIQTPEFCGACHNVNLPVLNQGMPVQRTYTEWKYSAFGRQGAEYRTCQDCHMPRLSHEYNDEVPGSYNADPYGEPGGWPYSKARTNTAVHKLAGANRGLAMMMKALYPEADFEVIGGAEGTGGVWVGTGNDVRIFPGMLSNRDSMFDRNLRNTEISLRDGVDVQISQAPTQVGTAADGAGVFEVKVKVINHTGHRLPSGFSNGQRMWVALTVSDGAAVVYRSGHYDEASARLFTDPLSPDLNRSLSNVIDGTGRNAVPGADGYLVWIRYGLGLTTASWDKLAIVFADQPLKLVNTAVNVNKTYGYKVQAFNGAGYGPASAEVYARTPWDLPLPPENLSFVAAGPTWVEMSWYDGSDNEDGWKVFRQEVPSSTLGYELIATFPSDTGFGGVSFTDGDMMQAGVTWPAGYIAPQPGRCYVYVVESFNASGNSGWNINGPVQMCTPVAPPEVVNILSAAYDAALQSLTVVATSSGQPGVQLTVQGYGTLGWKSWKNFYRTTFAGVTARPAGVTVTSSGGGSSTYVFPPPDTVAIQNLIYDASGQTLTVVATSSAQPGALLTADGYGPLVWKSWKNFYRTTFTGVLAPPASVTVTSSLGGTATLP